MTDFNTDEAGETPLWKRVPHEWRTMSAAERKAFDDLRNERSFSENFPTHYEDGLPSAWKGQGILYRLYRRTLKIQLESEYRIGPAKNPGNPNHDYEEWTSRDKEIGYIQRNDQLMDDLNNGVYEPFQEDLERAAYSLDLWGHLEGLEEYIIQGIIRKAPSRDILDLEAFHWRKKRQALHERRLGQEIVI